MDRQFVKQLNQELLQAAQEIANRHGLAASQKAGNFDDTSCKLSVQFSVVNDDGTVESPERKNFQQMATSYGLDPNDLDKVFNSNGEDFRIDGLKPKAQKYPVLATRVKDNKRFKFSADQLKYLLATQ